MKLLIYGSKGWIGQQFKNILDIEKINYEEGESRVDNIIDLKNEIKKINPTNIVCFIGRTHGNIGNKTYTTIDYLEQPGKLYDNIRDNLFAPLNMALIAEELNIHYTYLGTGCIFKFDKNHQFGKEKNGFDEDSEPNFFGSSYSIVKGFTDQIIKNFEKNVLNLRIRMPITDNQNPRNFITKITNYDKICSIPNSMTVLPELLPICLDMIKNKITGTINLTNPGLISHNEILEMFREVVDPDFKWKNFTIEEQNKILASERSNNFLETKKLEKLYPDVKNIKDSVKEILIKYKNSYKPKIEQILNINKIKKIFITGGAGFIGSNFINNFSKKYPDIKIINFDCLYYCADVNNICKEVQESENYEFIEGNLSSIDLLKNIFKNNNITHVLHFAAQSHVQNSFDDSLQYTKDNIIGTHNLLEVNRIYNKSLIKFIHVSTDEVYGDSMLDIDELKKTEHSILCPTNPYAATKAGAELISQSYNHSFKMPIIITRGNNVYGPNQYPEKLIPKFINLLKDDKKLTIQGDGSCVRSFLHVNDVVDAFEKILIKGKIGDIYNIGGDETMEYSVLNISKILIEKIKNTKDYEQWIDYIEDRPYNDKRYYISNKKLKDLGWNIKVSFEEGINNLINYTN